MSDDCTPQSKTGDRTGQSDIWHPDSPDFEYELKQAFKLSGDPDPEEYFYVTDRIWNYDADTRDEYYPPKLHHKQYRLAEVSTLGGEWGTVPEAVLDHEYEPVPMEEAKEVL